MKKIFFLILSLILILSYDVKCEDSNSPIIFIYDASGSMWGQIQGKD